MAIFKNVFFKDVAATDTDLLHQPSVQDPGSNCSNHRPLGVCDENHPFSSKKVIQKGHSSKTDTRTNTMFVIIYRIYDYMASIRHNEDYWFMIVK
jgi:hypothetical protein